LCEGDLGRFARIRQIRVIRVLIFIAGKSSQSIVGSEKSVEKWFSAQDQKAAAEMRLKLAKMEAKG